MLTVAALCNVEQERRFSEARRGRAARDTILQVEQEV